jgi:energy-coupling factor transporter ATPase
LVLSFIRITGVTYTYRPEGADPIQALRGIDLEIRAGEYVAVIGANGSGKTTLIRHLNALLLPTTGEVRVNGRNTRDQAVVRAIRADVGMVFQSPSDQIVATVVEEDVAFGPENLGVPAEELPVRVREALDCAGMWEARHRTPHLLSAGQQQRVAIAGALAMNPRCLVLDEATAMLDPAGRRDLLAMLDNLHQGGLTIISVTHTMEEAVRAQRVIVLHKGRIVLDDPPRQVFSNPAALALLGLEPPPVAVLDRRLCLRFPTLPADLLTPNELAAAIVEVLA